MHTYLRPAHTHQHESSIHTHHTSPALRRFSGHLATWCNRPDGYQLTTWCSTDHTLRQGRRVAAAAEAAESAPSSPSPSAAAAAAGVATSAAAGAAGSLGESSLPSATFKSMIRLPSSSACGRVSLNQKLTQRPTPSYPQASLAHSRQTRADPSDPSDPSDPTPQRPQGIPSPLEAKKSGCRCLV